MKLGWLSHYKYQQISYYQLIKSLFYQVQFFNTNAQQNQFKKKENKTKFGFVLYLRMLKNIFSYGIQISGVLNVADVVGDSFDHHVTGR